MIFIIYIFKDKKDVYVNAVVVKKPIDIQRGLMFRKKPLPPNEGMLFDFGLPKNNKIWMKNTFIPLDIIFLDENFKIIDFIENAIPLKEDLLGIDQKSRYVLEINGGWAKDKKIGQTIHINSRPQ